MALGIGLFDGAQFLAQRGQTFRQRRRDQTFDIVAIIFADQRQEAVAADEDMRAGRRGDAGEAGMIGGALQTYDRLAEEIAAVTVKSRISIFGVA